jgi:uncharacterized protein (DUF302 family)
MTQPAANGIATNGIAAIPSAHSVTETVARIRTTLEAKGVTLFAVIDHSGEAAKAGLHMPDTKLLIFGNPAAGTPLMLSAPSTAIDLPLKILVAEDQAGRVSISWNDPAWLQARHAFDPALIANIAVVEKLATAGAS